LLAAGESLADLRRARALSRNGWDGRAHPVAEDGVSDSPENRPEGFPSDLRRLLEAGDPGSRDEAWRAFLQSYSRLLLHTARGGNSRYDAAMDRYTHVLDQLRRDDFRRLRAYVDQGRGKFTTWLVVVAGRLCRDFDRQRYGRFRPGAASSGEGSARMARRRLVDLVGEQIDVARMPATQSPTPEVELQRKELAASLEAVLGRLDPGDRLLLKLRFEDDLSAREIASIMSFPTLFHVYRRLNHVLGELRRGLTKLGVSEPTP
jgi:RNA polymerase sigma factor (sigma-70 family)